MTDKREIRLLAIEDDELFAQSIADRLFEAVGDEVSVSAVVTLAEALEALANRDFDAVLLDLSLPDSTGLESLDRVRDAARDTPIVVLTGTHRETLGVDALRRGAQDYLTKPDSDGPTVARMVRYAIERQRLVSQLERTVARLHGEAAPQEHAAALPLKDASPELHRRLASRYTALVELALSPGLDAGARIADGTTDLARRLHDRGAGPRDVVDLHISGMNGLAASDLRSGSAATEGQTLLLELMGRTLSLYRDAAFAGAAGAGRGQ